MDKATFMAALREWVMYTCALDDPTEMAEHLYEILVDELANFE
jgi:hypothetical protein